MRLEFLTIGNYQVKEMYIQHIHEMINIELNVGDTYNVLFENLKKQYANVPKKLEAVEAWIAYNIETQLDPSVFNQVICETKKCYAAFNLRE